MRLTRSSLALLFIVISCKGADVEHDLYAGYFRDGREVASYSQHNRWKDDTKSIRPERGVSSPDFYKTRAKYECMKTAFSGAAGIDNAKVVEALDAAYAEATLGNTVALEQIDDVFRTFVGMMERAGAAQPEAYYNLGVVYSELREEEESQKWFRKAAAAGVVQAHARLHRR